MTAVSMVVVATIIASNDGDLTKALPIILMVFLLSGLIQIGLGALGVGTVSYTHLTLPTTPYV